MIAAARHRLEQVAFKYPEADSSLGITLVVVHPTRLRRVRHEKLVNTEVESGHNYYSHSIPAADFAPGNGAR